MEKQGDWQRVISITLNAFSRIDMLFQNAGLYKIDSIFLANKRTIPMYFVLMTFDRDKTINVIFMKQQEEVVLSDLPIFGIIGTKGQSFHTVEALV